MSTCFIELIRDHALDFICLQETMKKKYTGSFFFEKLTLMVYSFGSGFLPLANQEVSYVVLDKKILGCWDINHAYYPDFTLLITSSHTSFFSSSGGGNSVVSQPRRPAFPLEFR